MIKLFYKWGPTYFKVYLCGVTHNIFPHLSILILRMSFSTNKRPNVQCEHAILRFWFLEYMGRLLADSAPVKFGWGGVHFCSHFTICYMSCYEIYRFQAFFELKGTPSANSVKIRSMAISKNNVVSLTRSLLILTPCIKFRVAACRNVGYIEIKLR